MKKVYIAGALNSDAVGYLQNVHKMLFIAEKVRRLGVAVFVPALDMLLGIFSGDYEYKDYFENSQPFLDCCDAMFLVPGWEGSEGTEKEINRMEDLGRPIFKSMGSLRKYLREN